MHGSEVYQFLKIYIFPHGVPRSKTLYQGRGQTGQKIKKHFKNFNIELIGPPTYDHRTIRLVERLIQTIKRPLSCIKEAAQEKHQITQFFIN